MKLPPLSMATAIGSCRCSTSRLRPVAYSSVIPHAVGTMPDWLMLPRGTTSGRFFSAASLRSTNSCVGLSADKRRVTLAQVAWAAITSLRSVCAYRL